MGSLIPNLNLNFQIWSLVINKKKFCHFSKDEKDILLANSRFFLFWQTTTNDTKVGVSNKSWSCSKSILLMLRHILLSSLHHQCTSVHFKTRWPILVIKLLSLNFKSSHYKLNKGPTNMKRLMIDANSFSLCQNITKLFKNISRRFISFLQNVIS